MSASPRKDFHRYLTEPEERRLFATLKARAGNDGTAQLIAKRDLNWMRLLRWTGIRVTTLAGLNMADVREGLRTDHLPLRPEIMKRQRAGQVFLTKKAHGALRNLIAVRRAQGHAETPDAPLLHSRHQGRLSVRSLQARMAYWRQLAGLQNNASPHWWRHTLAKRLMKNSTAEDPRGVVQAVLGHKSIASTSVYTQPDKEDVQAALEEVC